MRQSYKGVTPETERAVDPCVKEVAAEMEVNPSYLYSILSGEKSDPFAAFRRLFRAVARKNPDGARGYLGSLNRLFSEANPPQNEASDLYEINVELGKVVETLRSFQAGTCSQEELEAVKHRFVEKFARLGLPAQIGEMQAS